MKINVTWSDIRGGKSSQSTQCMVALALKRELGTAYASVGYSDATVMVDGRPFRIYLPRKVGNLIRFWDRFHLVLPFSFEVVCTGFLTGHSLHVEPRPTATPTRALRGALLSAHT